MSVTVTVVMLLLLQAIAAENYPFCTIDPNEGRCPVPDERYDFLCKLWDPPSKCVLVLVLGLDMNS